MRVQMIVKMKEKKNMKNNWKKILEMLKKINKIMVKKEMMNRVI